MTPLHNLADHLQAHGIEAEAVTDANGEAVAVRLYLDGRAFNLQAHTLEGGRVRIAIEEYEVKWHRGAQLCQRPSIF